MNCGTCKTQLLHIEDLCFFYKRDKSVDLMIKYEKSTLLEDKFNLVEENSKMYCIKCSNCQSRLGTRHSFGPNHADIMAFGRQRVIVLGIVGKNKGWHQVYRDPIYRQIVVRDTSTFYGQGELTEILGCSPQQQSEAIPIVWPHPQDASTFMYNDVIMSDVTPRDYQITAYVEALQNNFVLVLPTGYGKTLVATIALAVMKILNPQHMILFIVDKIPLVFQQAEAISTDTHLRICPMTSEVNTSLKRWQLNRGFFDVLVSTAGSYLALEKEVSITKFCYVVFDECHHAIKSHDYVLILDLIKKCDRLSKPRVLGLTAFPPSSKSNHEAIQVQLNNFRKVFFNAPICHDLCLANYRFADALIEEEIVTQDPEWGLSNYQEKLVKELYRLADKVNKRSQGELIPKENWSDKNHRIPLMTVLHHLDLSHDVTIESCVKSMRKICEVLEITELLGVTGAHSMLKNLEVFEELSPQQISSPRLHKLFSILDRLSETSKIIVFVKTRRTAQILANLLQENCEINRKYSPLKIVGKSGLLGMDWLNEQDEIIEKFQKGNSNLLVSTSVLEEGIDIPDCDVVIRFDGVKSLISLIQSKGRARKWEKSKFITILTEEEDKSIQEMQKHETIVKRVLAEYHSDSEVPSKTTLGIKSAIEQMKTQSPPNPHSLLSSECAVEFYLTGSHELFDIQDIIAEFLFNKYFLRVKRIDTARSDWRSKGVFPLEDSHVTLGLHTQTQNIYQRYKMLTAEWSFGFNEKCRSVWTRFQLPSKTKQEIDSKWPVNMISWGKFDDKQTFRVANCESLPENYIGNFELTSKKCIEIILNICPQLTIEIPFTSIHRFILANWTDGDVTLYLPLSHCPVIRSESDGKLSCDECKYLGYFADSPVVGITLHYTKSNWSSLWILLHLPAIFPVPVFETRVSLEMHQMKTDYNIQNHPYYWDKQMQDCLWEFYVLHSRRDICLPDEAMDNISWEISQASWDSIRAITNTLTSILSLLSKGSTFYFFDLQKAFDHRLIIYKEQSNSVSPTAPLPNYCYIETAMVTPSGVIPLYPVLTQCNRLYRKFSEERFLSLAFCEENGEALKSRKVIPRVKNILKLGIRINGVNFHFLICSSSQLRSKKAIFLQIPDGCCASAKISHIRSQLIGNSDISNETKYLTRLGLFCTSDHPTCDINESEAVMLPDLFATDGGNLTDGTGKIKLTLANQILEKVELKNSPTTANTTAIQVRLAGLKGVLTIADDGDPDLTQNDRQYCIMYRKSMKKIEWTDSTLCLVRAAKYNKLFFNTQVITLLTSLEDSNIPKWDPKPKLKIIFRQALEANAKLFTDSDKASYELTSHIGKHNFCKETSKYFDILCEPYFLGLIRCIYTHNIRNLIERFHFPIKNGCLLMGIADPIGVLEDGEIFVSFEEPSDTLSMQIRTGRVLVYKNPCLHPGDLLALTAVDKDELHHLHNVIVFPVTGNSSLPARSGGGDLDGDEFGVVWDEDLVPPDSAVYPSLNYDTVLKEYKQKLASDEMTSDEFTPDQESVANRNVPFHEDENIQSILAECYCRVISNNLLGILSHYHVAISDMNGAIDELSLELARLASLAVDSPKTGVFPVIPDSAKKLISQRGYPDFMEKTESASYPSRRLLGELYQEAKSVCFQTNEWENLMKYYSSRDLDQNPPGNYPLDIFRIPGYGDYMGDAKLRYTEYANAIRTIMLSFGLETEAEVVLSLIVKCHPILTDRGKVVRALEAANSHLRQEFREKFHNDTPASDYLKKAASWYVTAYQQPQSDESTFLSFPWIVGEYLCEIVSMQARNSKQDFHSLIGKSAREHLLQNSDNIRGIVNTKLDLIPKIDSVINKYAKNACKVTNNPENEEIFKIEAYGSVTKYVCELQSDLDICATLTDHGLKSIPESEKLQTLEPRAKRKHLLQCFISPPLGSIADSKTEKFAGFPYLSLKVNSQSESSAQASVDITVESDGVLKAEYILEKYRTTGGLFFAFLSILIQWARYVGILKSFMSPDNTGVIITARFEALVLHIYEKMNSKPVPTMNNEIDSSLDAMLNRMKDPSLETQLGRMLEEFFWLGYKETSRGMHEIVYKWPIKGDPEHKIHKAALDTISGLLFQGWHCLTFTRDVTQLFELAPSELVFTKRFSNSMSNYLRTSTHFFETSLSNLTGALIKVEAKDRFLYLSARGSASALHELHKELSHIESDSALTKKYRSNASNYILEGSMGLVLSNFSIKCKITLNQFKHGYCREQHACYNKSVVLSANGETSSDCWKREGIIKIQSLLSNQLSRFPANNIAMLENLRLITRFGYFYVLNDVDSLHSIGNSLLLDEFEKCLLKGKNNRKFEFIENEINSLTGRFQSLQIQPTKPVGDESPKPIPEIRDTIPYMDRVLSCAFCPGIDLVERSEVKNSKSLFAKSLEECGFRHFDRAKYITWMINIDVTFFRAVKIILDENLQAIEVSENHLVWMLATIIADRTTIDPKVAHDIRLRSESSSPLEKDSEIYKAIFPNGTSSPLIEINKIGQPILCERLADKLRLIKHYQEVVFYKLDNTVAKLTTGVEYCPENLKQGREFCELSLYHNEVSLRDAVKSGDYSRITAIAAAAVELSLKLSEAIYLNTI